MPQTTTRPITNMPGKFVTLCEAGEAYLVEHPSRALFRGWDGAKRYWYIYIYDPTVAGEMRSLARCIANAGRGQRVKCRNGDVTDLRLSNLLVERGGAKGQSPNPRRPGSEF